MPGLIYDDEQSPSSSFRIRSRQRPLHSLFGGGRVANILLWRNKQLSAGILGGVTLIWFLFEVMEYHFLTLLCHVFILTMLVIFIWSNVAPLFGRNPPRIPEFILSEHAFRNYAIAFHRRFNQLILILHDIACGRDLKMFLLAIVSLWIISVIGSYCSALSLLYFCFLCLFTIPALYKQYEGEVDHFATKGSQDLKKIYKKFNSKFLKKIPRATVDKKKRLK